MPIALWKVAFPLRLSLRYHCSQKNEKPISTEQEPKNQQARLRIRISTRHPFYITLTGLLKGALVWRENVFSWGRMLIGTRRAVEQLVLNLFTAKSTILIISVVGSPVGPALTARKPTGMARSNSLTVKNWMQKNNQIILFKYQVWEAKEKFLPNVTKGQKVLPRPDKNTFQSFHLVRLKYLWLVLWFHI